MRGLHARAAAKFAKLSAEYTCTITVSRKDGGAEGGRMDGRSILGLMMLAAEPGVSIIIETEGKDAEAALQVLAELVENRFGEDS